MAHFLCVVKSGQLTDFPILSLIVGVWSSYMTYLERPLHAVTCTTIPMWQAVLNSAIYELSSPPNNLMG